MIHRKKKTDNKFFDGIKLGLGFIFIIGLLFGVVYAVGFHTANEIIGGTFLGNYTYSGNVNFTNANLIGINTGTTSCPNSEKLVNNGTNFICGSFSGYSSSTAGLTCNDIYKNHTSKYSPIDGTYWIDPDGIGGNVPFEIYCDMTSNGGGWTRVVGIKDDNLNHKTSGAYTISGLKNLEEKGKLSDLVINSIKDVGVLRLSCNQFKVFFNISSITFNSISNAIAYPCSASYPASSWTSTTTWSTIFGPGTYNGVGYSCGGQMTYANTKGCYTTEGFVSGTLWIK